MSSLIEFGSFQICGKDGARAFPVLDASGTCMMMWSSEGQNDLVRIVKKSNKSIYQ